jgi:VanZ family protein
LRLLQSKWLALSWLVMMCILFFLPGSAFPKEDWFSAVYFDKWVHIGLFAVLLFLWRSSFYWDVKNYNFILLTMALLYGLMVEIIQKEWIPNRDFDLFDVAADMAGSFLGLFVWMRVYKKNKPL